MGHRDNKELEQQQQIFFHLLIETGQSEIEHFKAWASFQVWLQLYGISV